MNQNLNKSKPYKTICLACQQLKDCLSHLTAKIQYVLPCLVFPQRRDSSQLAIGLLSPHILPLNITQIKFCHCRSCLLYSQNIQGKMQVKDKCCNMAKANEKAEAHRGKTDELQWSIHLYQQYLVL